MEGLLGFLSGILIVSAYYLGKFRGVKATFDYLEKEKMIIKKADIKKLFK